MSTPTLYDILSRKLEQKCKEHPSFRLMKIDDRLFPNAQTKHSTLVLEARNSNDELKTVAEIVAESWGKGDKNHLMIEGEGGIGKTVTLLSIPDKFTPFPVPAIYIPLHELPQGDDPIERYIKKRVLSNKEDLYGQLLNLLEKPWDKGPQLLLLLDGFNEIAAEKRPTISEDIKYWSELQGIQIVTSSRYDIHTYVALSYDYSAIKLQPLSNTTVEAYLNSMGVRIPTDSAVKELITIPLLLTLYVKTELILEQRETDSAEFKEAKNAGSIVWNYLQCELWHFGKENQDAKNAIIAMEFIAPYMAWQMQQNSLFILDKKEFHKFLGDAYTLLENHSNKPDDFPFQMKDILQKADGIPSLETIRNLLENHLCLFVKNGNSYKLMHQQFRDALAAMHLINSIYLNGDSRPMEWNSTVDHYVMQFVADLIDEKEANRLWEQNRTSPQLESATRNQLELQRKLHDCDFSKLDFSNLDLSNISMYPYRATNAMLKLPTDATKTKGIKLSERTFSTEGHTSYVYTLTVTLNGKFIVSGSDDKTICIWDLDTGAKIRTIKGQDVVTTVAVTPDSKTIISGGSHDNTIHVWDLETGIQIRTIKGHENGVRQVAVTPDGKYVVSSSWDNTIRMWNLETGTQIKAINAQTIPCFALTPDGKSIVYESTDNTICIWDIETEALIGEPYKVHDDNVNVIVVTSDGKRIISGSRDRTIRICDLKSGTQICNPLRGHRFPIFTVDVTPDGKRIVCASWYSIFIWNMETGTQTRTANMHEGVVAAVTITPDGKRFISGSHDKTIRVWDLETGTQIRVIKRQEILVDAIAVIPDNKRFVCWTSDNIIHVWNLETGTQITTIEGNENGVSAVAVTPDRKYIISGSKDNTIRIWDLNTGVQTTTIKGHEGSVAAVTVTPDSKYIISGSKDNTIRIWDLKTGVPIGKPLVGHEDWVNAVAVTPDGKRIVSGSQDKTIRIWDFETHNPIGDPIQGHEGFVNAIAITADSKCIVSGSDDNTIRIWDIDTRIPITNPIRHNWSVSALEVTHDGKYIIGKSPGYNVYIWDLNSGILIEKPLKGHGYFREVAVKAVAVTPDDKYILNGSNDENIYIADIESHNFKTIQILPLSVVGLDFSKAIISTPELKEQLRQNGAIV